MWTKTAAADLCVIVGLFWMAPPAEAAPAKILGHVVDEDGSPVCDADIAVHAAQPGGAVVETQSDATGGFELSLPEPGDYLLNAGREGYYALRDEAIHLTAPSQELTVTLHTVRDVFQSVKGAGQTSPIELADTNHRERLTGAQINSIPYANSHSLLASFRYPLDFDLNLAVERTLTFHGYRFAVRGGVKQANPLRASSAPSQAKTETAPTALLPPAAPPPPEAPTGEFQLHPSASIYGNTGLWKVLTADTLSAHGLAVSTWYDRINRNPGDLVISTAGFGGAVGITSRLELGVSFEANREVTTGQPEELSFGQEALGFYGAKTPGSKPLPTELMPGSSLVPQLRWPPGPYGALTGAAGYFNLYPFAGLVPSGNAAGDFIFGLKIRLLSQGKRAPFSLAIRPYFDLPVHKAVTFLETHPIGTADLQGGGDGILSRTIGNTAEISLNAGYRYISQPAHVSIFHLRSDVPLGFGMAMPRSARIQLIAESTADVFVGAHTPNTTFGPEDPVDLTIGFRAKLPARLAFSGGYRRPLNQFGGDKNGFVISLGFAAK